MYNYSCKLDRVIDGDTVVLTVDLGFRMSFTESFRLIGIDTPELRGDEKEMGQWAKAFVQGWFDSKADQEIVVCSHKRGKFRWLAEIWCGTECLNDELIYEGLAVPMDD